jgi:hypothetical protein
LKQIYSAFTAIAFFVSLNAFSQINENFNSELPSTSNCWITNNITHVTNNTIEGAGSASAIEGEGEIQTPFLDFDGTATISFTYKLSNTLNGTRTIKIETINKDGVRTQIGTSIIMNSTTGTGIALLSRSITSTSVERIAITVTKVGEGAVTVLIDNLVIEGAAYNYSEVTPCNTAPVTEDDNYFSVYPYSVEGNVLTNDGTPESNENYSATLVQNVEEGLLVLSNDGNFNYTPPVNFAGGPITFTYRINDNGFTPLTSNVATVTLNYAIQTLLPVKLTYFSGNVINQRAEFKWTLEANETGDFIQVEKSTDGKTFTLVSVVMNTAKAGSENYSSTDASLLTTTTYYRLKMVNKTSTFSYSKIIVLKNSTDTKASTITVLRNPVQESIAFNYNSTETGVAIINVYNAAGLKMMSFQHTMQKGINSIDKPLSVNFNNGSYIMEVIKNNERSVVKLLK